MLGLDWFDSFVLLSGSVGVAATVPLVYLALRAHRETRALRMIQREVAALVVEAKDVSEEVRDLQHELRKDQRETLRFVAPRRRRRLRRAGTRR